MELRKLFCHYFAKFSQLHRKYIKSLKRVRYKDQSIEWTTDEMWFDSQEGRGIPLLSYLFIRALNLIPSPIQQTTRRFPRS